jgi:streptogramin lyase
MASNLKNKNKQIAQYVNGSVVIYSLSKLSMIEKMLIRIMCTVIFVFTSVIMHSQVDKTITSSQVSPDPYIKWICQFPEIKADGKSRFKGRFLEYTFGKGKADFLFRPVSVVANDSANFWILDQEVGLILKVKDGVGEMPHYKGKNPEKFPSLVGVCLAGPEKILFTDSYNNRLYQYEINKKTLSIFNDTLQLNRPTGIAYSPVNQSIYVVETNAHQVTELDESGRILRRIGTRGTLPGEFNFPTSIWIDDSGKIFIVDAMNFRIQIFSPNGELISVFGKTGDATGYFARPKGIATDSQGNIYVADALFNTIQIFDVEGKFLYNFGAQGRGEGEFWMPSGIYIDKDDYIYVADSYNSRIQVFRLIKGTEQ